MNSNALEILLVEDNSDDVELTLYALRKNHLANQVYVVGDGEEALDFLFCRGPYSARRFDSSPKLILLDLKLPKVDGVGVLRAVKADARTRGVPIVVMISAKEQRDLIEGYQLGVNDYILKPIDFEQFHRIIDKLGFSWLVIRDNSPSDSPQK